MTVDLTSAVRFDLHRGAVEVGSGLQTSAIAAKGNSGAGDRAMLVPEEVMSDLVAGAGPDIAGAAARQLGSSMGKRVSDRLGGPNAVRESSLETVISALAAEVAVSGFGRVSLERWGRAMVLVVEHAPRIEGGFFASMLQGRSRLQ